MEKDTNKMLAFLDVCISNKDPCTLLTSVHRKNTFTGLLTAFSSFTSYSYKIGLIRTLVDRAYRINNTLAKFNDDVKKLFDIVKKNQYPEGLITRVVHSYLDTVHSSNNSKSATDTSTYFKLPFLKLSNFTQRKVCMLAKKYCLLFKHLKTSTPCKTLFSEKCLKVLDSASTYHNVKIKEALHIMWERPNLNKQLQHYNISVSF